MGREVRRVPKDWQHPKDELTGRYKPLMSGEDYPQRVKEWKEEYAKWEAGERPSYCGEESRELEYWEYNGNPPHREDYMPNWPEAERTHLMMYEDTSEGTPISPAFDTPEELARWLVDNNASAFGREGASYEGWLAIARGGWAPGAVMIDGRIQSGVEFAATRD